MVQIQQLPLAQTPLSGGELVPVLQNGILVQCNQAAFAIPASLQLAITTVETNLPAINLVATNINAILAANFSAASTSFNPAGLTYLTGSNLQTVGQETDAAIAAVVASIPTSLANYALKSGNLTQFASSTPAQLASVITLTTGVASSALVFANSPTLTSPTLVTPVLGIATATTINGQTITAGVGTLTLSGNTLTATGTGSVQGTNTGDQTITINGAVTGTGTTTFTSSQVIHGTMNIGTVANQTIILISYSEYALTVNGINNLKCSSGSCTIDFQINGTPITSLHNLSVTGTGQSPSATGANTMSVGDQLTVVITNNSSATNLQFTMKATR